MFSIAREVDEGTAAHIWQILMSAQIQIVAFFAIKWLTRATRQALLVLALKCGAAFEALAPVFFLNI